MLWCALAASTHSLRDERETLTRKIIAVYYSVTLQYCLLCLQTHHPVYLYSYAVDICEATVEAVGWFGSPPPHLSPRPPVGFAQFLDVANPGMWSPNFDSGVRTFERGVWRTDCVEGVTKRSHYENCTLVYYIFYDYPFSQGFYVCAACTQWKIVGKKCLSMWIISQESH